jgi:hypothetical protein
MSALKDKVAGYLSTFIDLEEWKPTRDDPYGDRLVKAAVAKDTDVASAWPRPAAAKAELKTRAAEPLKGTLDLDKPLGVDQVTGVERPKATEPTLSRGARTTPPEVQGVKPVRHDAPVPSGRPQYKDEPVGGSKSPEHTGGLANPHPIPRPSPEMQAKLGALSKAHIGGHFDKMKAGRDAVVASKGAEKAQRVADVKTHAEPTKPENAGRTKKQQYHDRRKAWRAGVRLGVNDPSTPAPHHSVATPTTNGDTARERRSSLRTGSNLTLDYKHKVGTDVRRVDTAVTTALMAASKNNPAKQNLLKLQARAPNHTPYDRANALPTPEPVSAPATSAATTTGKGSFVSQEVLADLRKKAGHK